ncbi:hypothetical protein CAPTEDRAFT_201220 [Capitella teleta]|uniref:Uncharacterized protein n=1 Tax=Capitella teleta TaxID=283909 RepID=R7VE50_CAPTE|nr:hypothetical protein CAPTEDRAFT_201220 [Capitella teleta]|eukprot:ELU16842.1 hypothetical protein CAPTEDRAFT_201220 [Capitella teleta]
MEDDWQSTRTALRISQQNRGINQEQASDDGLSHISQSSRASHLRIQTARLRQEVRNRQVEKKEEDEVARLEREFKRLKEAKKTRQLQRELSAMEEELSVLVEVQGDCRSVESSPSAVKNVKKTQENHMSCQPKQFIDSHEDLAQALVAAVRVSKLPFPEPIVFKGDPLLYREWDVSFRQLIKKKRIPPQEPLHYLKKYLSEIRIKKGRFCEEEPPLLRVSEGWSRSLSLEDQRFLSEQQAAIQHNEKGHFEMPLPFWTETVSLPCNRAQALHRFKQLRRRLKKDKKIAEDYLTFMKKMLTLGYAEEILADKLKKR